MTAPLLFMLLYAALEIGHVNMVLNATEAACYEGARTGIVPGATAAECQAAAQRILDISRIRGATVQVRPNDLSVRSPTVEVVIDVPYLQTSIITPTFTRGLTLSRACELVREEI
ncbi:MAG: pilus assembly protein [Planctomycetales bacterium]|nr:pilus assembly protein [Planctomycetales bacterium]